MALIALVRQLRLQLRHLRRERRGRGDVRAEGLGGQCAVRQGRADLIPGAQRRLSLFQDIARILFHSLLFIPPLDWLSTRGNIPRSYSQYEDSQAGCQFTNVYLVNDICNKIRRHLISISSIDGETRNPFS